MGKDKGPGFYTPMDIAPGEYPATTNHKDTKVDDGERIGKCPLCGTNAVVLQGEVGVCGDCEKTRRVKMPDTKTDDGGAGLREQLWEIMGRRNQKILDAQKTDALVLPYFKADDEAATEILDLFNATIDRLVEAVQAEKKSIEIEIPDTLHRNVGWNQAIDQVTDILLNIKKEVGND